MRSIVLVTFVVLPMVLLTACGEESDNRDSTFKPTPAPNDMGNGDDSDTGTDPDTGVDSDTGIDPETCSRGTVASGLTYSCALDCDGALSCWGGIVDSQTFLHNLYSATDTIGPPDARWKDLDASRTAACAVTEEGDVWCWGLDVPPELGRGIEPTPFSDTSDWERFVIGDFFRDLRACGIKTDGSLHCLDPEAPQNGLEPIESDRRWIDVDVGDGFTCALDDENTVWCWGENESGQLGQGESREASDVPVAVEGAYIEIVTYQVSACALDMDRKAHCWGGGEGSPSEMAPEYAWLSFGLANGFGFCGVDLSGDIRCQVPLFSPITNRGNFEAFESESKYVAAAPGASHVCGITTAGVAECTGANQQGQSGTGTAARRWDPDRVGDELFSSVTVAESSTCAISADGVPSCWGGFVFNDRDFVVTPEESQAPEALTKIEIQELSKAGVGESGALYRQGELDLLSAATSTWVQVGSESDWTDIAMAGQSMRACGIRAGQIWCGTAWDELSVAHPDSDWLDIDGTFAGDRFCAVKAGGSVWCNINGGEFTRFDTMDGLSGIVVAQNDLCALDSTGALYCASFLTGGFERVGGQTWTEISGDSRSGGADLCGIRSDGQMDCFRSDGSPLAKPLQGTGNPPGSSIGEFESTDWVDIATSANHACGLRGQGELWCWGRGDSGELGFGDAFVFELTPVAR